MKNGLIEMMHI